MQKNVWVILTPSCLAFCGHHLSISEDRGRFLQAYLKPVWRGDKRRREFSATATAGYGGYGVGSVGSGHGSCSSRGGK